MMRPGLFVLLIGYTAGLGLIAWTLLRPGAPAPVGLGPGDVALPTFDAPPPAIESLQAFNAILERPLFQADRKAASDAPQLAASPVEPVGSDTGARLDGFRLAAVFSGSGGRSAIVELPNGDSMAVREGDRLENWQVLEIRDEQLVLAHRGRQQTLQVHDFAYLPKPRVIQRNRALTERGQRANRRQSTNTRTTRPVPRQRRREEEREDDD